MSYFKSNNSLEKYFCITFYKLQMIMKIVKRFLFRAIVVRIEQGLMSESLLSQMVSFKQGAMSKTNFSVA